LNSLEIQIGLFIQRQEFTNLYGAMTNQQFVDALMSRYNLQSVTTITPASPDDTVAARVTLSRSNLVSQLTAGTLTRGKWSEQSRTPTKLDKQSSTRRSSPCNSSPINLTKRADGHRGRTHLLARRLAMLPPT
jgi:hypothetical protein